MSIGSSASFSVATGTAAPFESIGNAANSVGVLNNAGTLTLNLTTGGAALGHNTNPPASFTTPGR